MVRGWISQFHVALTTNKRIILHGNVMDLVPLEGEERSGGALPLVDWLWRSLQERGYRRIVHYAFEGIPQVLSFDDLEGRQAWRAFSSVSPDVPPSVSDDNPQTACERLRGLVESDQAPAAVVISNAELRVTYPSADAVALHAIGQSPAQAIVLGAAGQEVGDQARRQNVVIHIYARETSIPQEFIASDPDTRLIFLAPPSFEQRRDFIRDLLPPNRRGIVHELARATEGYRLKQIQQILSLAEDGATPEDLPEIVNLFRFGRKVDFWANLNIRDVGQALGTRIEGQREAVDQVIDALYRAKHKIHELIDDSSRRPAMVLFFVGATGVGKTLLARLLAEHVTGNRENLRIIDMSEYQQDHSEQRLIGPPPGYVGHLHGGQLTNWVKERPHSVVLFDEVDKAHERILDIFLQILDGARLTDGKGETVDFTETVLIFTSNYGTSEGRGVNRADRAAVQKHFLDEVEKHFNEIERPELYNRLRNGVVVFNFIPREYAERVLRRTLETMIRNTNLRLREQERGGEIDMEAGFEQVVGKLMEYVRFEEYGLRDVVNVLIQRVGGAFARHLDEATARSYPVRPRWNDERGVVDFTRKYDARD